MSDLKTIVDLLQLRASENPDHTAYRFLAEGEVESSQITYAQQDSMARAIAAALLQRKARGERALLLYPPTLDFISAFLGCLYAGVIAVPLYPPRSDRSLLRLASVALDARPRIILTIAASLPAIKAWASQMPGGEKVEVIATDELSANSASHWVRPGIHAGSIAFLQYTSGSTAAPKGVIVTHGNLLHNEEMISRAFAQSESSIIVSWLPLYHDMGLIGGVLQPLYLGAECILMSPLGFVQKPVRWLQAITKYRATTSGGPNFAYDLCAAKIKLEEREKLDLSSWSVAFNGAEPVRADTLKRFSRIFAACGFKNEAFYPCYGLAEATLFVSGGSTGSAPRIHPVNSQGFHAGRAIESTDWGAKKLVSCGRSWSEQQIVVVNPEEKKRCAEDTIGEIWISGPSVAQGYWNRPEETARDFNVSLNEEHTKENRRFLRTGDLGFLHGEELFITGRIKDLIIVRGRNHYPQDLEVTAERTHAGLRPGCGAAFSIESDNEERVVLVQEVDQEPLESELQSIIESIRSAVSQEHELALHDVVLIKGGTIPKTSSGKIQRQACKAKYLKDQLQIVARNKVQEEQVLRESLLSIEQVSREALLSVEAGDRQERLERLVAALAARALRIPERNVVADQSLSALGLDSLAAIELKHAVEERSGISLSLAALLEGATVAQLAASIALELEKASTFQARPKAANAPPAEFPLSYGQRGLWFVQQIAPESSVYNITVAARAKGPLDVRALGRALELLTERHPALRTTFHHGVDGEPIQRVHDSMPADVEFAEAHDWTEDMVLQRLSQKAGLAFDLEHGPLFRIVVLRRLEQEHFILFCMHHICGDFWSFTIAFDELKRVYCQEAGTGTANLPLLETRYSDYVEDQRQRLNSSRGAELWEYWREKLQLPLPDLDLPIDHPRPPVQTYRGGTRTVLLESGLASSLHHISRSCGATLYMTLLAAFQVFLCRYTTQEDIVVGSPVAGRSVSEEAGLVGYFTNPLVMRLRVRHDATFKQVLQEVRHTVAGALENQEYPFPLLIERLRPVRDPSRSALFQAMFILQKAHRAELNALATFALGHAESQIQFGPLTLQAVEVTERQVPFDLILVMSQAETTLTASLQYNRDLFEDASAERMLRLFRTFLQGIASDPNQKIQALPLLSEQDVRELRAWNATGSSYPRENLIHELFEAQVARTPEAPAVEDAKHTFTYAELNRRANQLARYLRKLGIGPESIVGVCLERTAEIAVALLGVLKSGGSYLPLDPAFPENRVRFMLEDADAQVVLSEVVLQPIFADFSRRIVLLDRDWPDIATEEASDKITDRPDPDNLAYVIYTSGSTGLPKGVQISHQAVVNFLTSMAHTPGMAATDVLVSVTTISFDIFGLELYLPLIAGAKVVVASREVAMDGYALLELLKKSCATVMQATPATWQLLLTSNKRRLPPMRAFCGGDVLPAELVRELCADGCSVWNLYGPTETTIWSAVHKPAVLSSSLAGTIIGKPIANTQIHIVDSNLQPLPVGVPGELVIGGEGIARGYWKRPELTAEKFVPDPFSNKPGARLYRTGDLARWRTDGEIEFLGRLDNQVKVRGYRIELGEIESVLSSYPGVQKAVVVVRKQSSSDQRLVAYVVPKAGGPTNFDAGELRGFLSQRLPEAFLPSHFVSLTNFPLTPNGKVDRRALPDPQTHVPEHGDYLPPQTELERGIAEIWKQVLNTEKVGIHDNFFDLGGHSLLLAQVQSRLREAGHDISMIDLFRWPTIADLAQHIVSDRPTKAAVEAGVRAGQARRAANEGKGHDIAIIGMAGRFPRAANVEEFWQKISRGEECISFFSDQELKKLGVNRAVLEDSNYVKAGGVLEGEDLFDAAFFGFNPREAELMDPQQRLFLECAWHALEDAGYNSDGYSGRVGVFAGAGLNTYLHQAAPTLGDSSSLRYQAFIGNDKDFIATRVSYKLNLRGPSVTVQTACSTSLVAVHLACQSLLNKECDIAMAGAVGVRLSQREGYLYEKGGILSPDGHCRAFDKDAGGTIFGCGMGVVVLKALEAALEDGDTIYAVIKGTAINNDGSFKIGYTAPSVEGQTQVVAEALAVAGVDAETVSYIEAHGTGTALGDPMEIAALSDVFKARTDRKGFCAIGSVKTNIGHLDTAAGIAGLIKTVCALRYGQIPPSLNFHEPNPKIDFAASPFYVNTQLSEWQGNGIPRRAGVSSFGIGGTNAHVVLEEAPSARHGNPSSRPWNLLTLSAKTASALEKSSQELTAALNANRDTELADVSYTLQVGRRAFSHRRAVLCQNHNGAIAALESLNPEQVFTESSEDQPPEIAFLFPGQGSQYINMGKELYGNEPTFRGQVDTCAQILKPHLPQDIRQLLFSHQPPPEQAATELEQTVITQPALFVVEYALAHLWMEWGLRPQAMLGHSIGEYVAACLAGVISLEGALRLVAIRGRLMQSVPPGAMLGIRLPEAEVTVMTNEDISLAAVNSPNSCVVSGTAQAISGLEKILEAKGIAFSRLHTSHAFHSSMMDAIVEDFVAAVRKVPLHFPRIPYISNLSGDWITEAQATDPRYWGKQLRHTVRFADGIHQLTASGKRLLLECGPGHTLSALARQQNSKVLAISSLRHASEQHSDSFTVLRALGKLWLKGTEIAWNRFYAHEHRRRVPLPHYPFERQRFWIKSDATQRDKNQTINDWLYVPCWQPSALLLPADEVKLESPVLIFEDGLGFGRRLAERLRKHGSTVGIARKGSNFTIVDDRTYELHPGKKEHYTALLDGLTKAAAIPKTIVHCWNLTASTSQPANPIAWSEARSTSFDSLLFLAQALENKASNAEIRISVLSNNMQKTGGEHMLQPEKAMLLGPVKVIPQEYPNIRCKSIDLLLPEFDGATENLIDDLVVEVATSECDQVAYRGRERWTKTFGPWTLPRPDHVGARLREKGVYLITGGLGGVGLTFAEKLAKAAQARLILTGRSAFPEKAQWEEWASAHGEQDEQTRIIRRLQSLEQSGAEILYVTADVADLDAMRAALRIAEQHFGVIQGVVHAAGVPGGGMIQLKDQELADAVLKPKVQGTLVLHSLFKEHRLDFFVLCSSINAIVGGFGQSDYAAANAFCDAFAQAQFHHRGCYITSIDWDRWNEVGMAARAFSVESLGLPRFIHPQKEDGHSSKHMLLGTVVAETHEKALHIADFSPEQQWVLSEHRIAGHPIVPGTTYLEMARAAFARRAANDPISIYQVVFPAPLIVEEGETRNVLTILQKAGEKSSFRIISKAAESENGRARWVEHAHGEIGPANSATNRQRRDIEQLLGQFEKEVPATNGSHAPRRKFIAAGPRWQVLKKVYVREEQSLAILELDERFSEDLAHFWLHPAILDVATGFVHFLLEGDYLPLAYERLTIWAPFPKKIFSHLRLQSGLNARDVITSDISIFDESGLELARIEAFSMKRVREDSITQWQKPASSGEAQVAIEQKLQSKFTTGISAQQGAEIFHRILMEGRSPQVIVSTRNLHEAIQEAAEFNRTNLLAELDSLNSLQPAHARPEVSSAYTEPGSEFEQRIAAIWQRVLGIERVGIYDNFFELGGTSLNGVQLVAALKKELKVDIPAVSIFEAPTVAALAKYLRPGPGEAVLERVQSRVERKKQALGVNQHMRAGAGRER